MSRKDQGVMTVQRVVGVTKLMRMRYVIIFNQEHHSTNYMLCDLRKMVSQRWILSLQDVTGSLRSTIKMTTMVGIHISIRHLVEQAIHVP